jgi:recombination DNA repair RAD52 pathway protein
MALSKPQIEHLFKSIDGRRVKERQGFAYLESWDVIAHLNRVFGFTGHDKEIEYALVYETERTTGKWDVSYSAKCRLIIKDPDGEVVKVSEDVATGQAQNQPSRGDAHDLAIKSAVSDALKRAAKDLGDQFGLGLYSKDGGSKVGKSLAYADDSTPPVTDPSEVRERVAELRDAQLGERDTPVLP